MQIYIVAKLFEGHADNGGGGTFVSNERGYQARLRSHWRRSIRRVRNIVNLIEICCGQVNDLRSQILISRLVTGPCIVEQRVIQPQYYEAVARLCQRGLSTKILIGEERTKRRD